MKLKNREKIFLVTIIGFSVFFLLFDFFHLRSVMAEQKNQVQQQLKKDTQDILKIIADPNRNPEQEIGMLNQFSRLRDIDIRLVSRVGTGEWVNVYSSSEASSVLDPGYLLKLYDQTLSEGQSFGELDLADSVYPDALCVSKVSENRLLLVSRSLQVTLKLYQSGKSAAITLIAISMMISYLSLIVFEKNKYIDLP